jgi:L-threonylcarbamoyladenylate synthase
LTLLPEIPGEAVPLQTRILDAFLPEAVAEAAEIIKRGGLVAFPTETVYGLGADACNPIAVARIFEVKRRPAFDPVIVHVGDPASALLYGDCAGGLAQALIRTFWPGPLTLVVPKTVVVPPVVTAGLDTVGIRMPANRVALSLIRACGRAIAAPSANPFGYVSPTEAGHVADQLEGVDLILDGGRCPVGVESTILSLAGPQPCLLRSGGVPAEELEPLTGPLLWSTEGNSRPDSPGQLARHYATRTPLRITDEPRTPVVPRRGERVGLLSLLPPADAKEYAAVEVLSVSGDLREAAANLFAALRRLDALGLDRLEARCVPETGLGIAIMDRLRRCAQPDCAEKRA